MADVRARVSGVDMELKPTYYYKREKGTGIRRVSTHVLTCAGVCKDACTFERIRMHMCIAASTHNGVDTHAFMYTDG